MNNRTINFKDAVDIVRMECGPWTALAETIFRRFKKLSSTDAIQVVRCKDCKHRPTGTNRDDLEFPDDICPCKCEDYWYSWKPADDWFCGNGEQYD